MNVVELVSPLPLDECCDRLRTGMDGPMTFFGSHSVIGRVHGLGFRARRRTHHRSAFRPHILGDLSDWNGQTHIRCTFAMDKVAVAVLGTLLGIVLLMFGGMLAATLVMGVLRSIGLPDLVAQIIAAPVGGLGAGYAIYRAWRHYTRSERRFLVDFVCATLRATPATKPDGT